MPIGIKDRLLFQLTINGKEVNLQQNTLQYLHIVESVRLHLPMMSMVITDATQFFSRNDVLVDGAQIQVTIGIEDKKLVFPMRLFNHKELPQEGAQAYRIHAYLDVPLFWTSSQYTIINNTASGALKEICNKTGLTFVGPETADQQLWIPYNRKYKDFARYITSRSFVEDGSCMQSAVNFNKQFRLVDVSKFEKLPTKQTFNNAPTSGQSQIADWNLLNRSGFLNSVSGYADSNVSQSVLKDDVIIDATKVVKNTAKLMMSEAVRKAVGQNRVIHAPIDVGNVNANYQKGIYQNQRLGNLFNTGLEFITPDYVDADLMEVVNCVVSRPGAQGVTNISGRYMITSKVYYVSHNSFTQKLEVFRHGLNDRTEKTQA